MKSRRPKSGPVDTDENGTLLAGASGGPSGARKVARRRQKQRSDPDLGVLSAGSRSETGFVDRTLQLWLPRSARKLNSDDARQIAANMTGFFKILAEWQKK